MWPSVWACTQCGQDGEPPFQLFCSKKQLLMNCLGVTLPRTQSFQSLLPPHQTESSSLDLLALP